MLLEEFHCTRIVLLVFSQRRAKCLLLDFCSVTEYLSRSEPDDVQPFRNRTLLWEASWDEGDPPLLNGASGIQEINVAGHHSAAVTLEASSAWLPDRKSWQPATHCGDICHARVSNPLPHPTLPFLPPFQTWLAGSKLRAAFPNGDCVITCATICSQTWLAVWGVS